MPRNRVALARLTAATVLVALAGRASAQPVTWDGDCDNAWESFCSGGTVSNWDNDALPNSNNDVLINGVTVKILSNQAPQVVKDFTLNDGGLNGWLATLGDATVTNAAVTGILESNGFFDFAGTSTFGGTLRGGFSNSGTWTFNDGFVGTAGRPAAFANTGTATIKFEPSIADNSSFTNLGDVIFANGGITGSGIFENYGNVTYNSPGAAVIGVPFVQAGGTTSVQSGELRFVAPSEYAGGTMSAQSGATLRFFGVNTEQKFSGLSEITGTGTALFDAGPAVGLTVTAPLTVNMTAPGVAHFANTGLIDAPITNLGFARFTGTRFQGTSGSFTNESGGVVEVVKNTAGQLATDVPYTNRGYTLSLSAVGASSVPFVTITNDTGGVWDMVSPYAASVFFDNNGTVYRRTVGSETPGNASLSRFSQNNGTVNLEAATTSFTNGGQWDGDCAVNVTSPASGGFASGVHVINGTTTITTTADLFEDHGVFIFSDGNNLANYVRVNGHLILDSAAIPQTSTQRMQLAGTIKGQGRTDNFGGFEVVSGSTLGGDAIPGTFANHSFFRVSSGLNIFNIFDNDGTVHQRASITVNQPGRVINSGDWTVGPSALIQGSTLFGFENTGNFIADEFGDPSLSASKVLVPFDNQGAVLVRAAMLLEFSNVLQIQDGVLSGGVWIVEPGAELKFDQFPVQSIGPGATVVGGEQGIPALQSINSVKGKLKLNQSLHIPGGLKIEDGGEITVSDGPILVTDAPLTNGRPAPVQPEEPTESILDEVRTTTQVSSELPGSLLAPAACPTSPHIVAPTFDNYAVLNPGPDGEPHAMWIEADTTLHETSTLKIDLAGTTPCEAFDQLLVDGPLTVGGTIEVRFAPGYEPLATDTFRVVDSTLPIAGSFARVQSPIFDTNKRLRAVVGGNSVDLVATCAADLNADGFVDQGDIQSFLALFLVQDPAVDFNGDTFVDLGDIQAFIAAFLAGC